MVMTNNEGCCVVSRANRAHAAKIRRRSRLAAAGAIATMLAFLHGGCALTPHGTKEEQARLERTGAPFEPPFEQRTLPEISAEPTWMDILHRAFLANGELEAAYFRWKAAVQRIDIASAYPNSNVSVGYEYEFSSERMKSFDRMSFSVGFDAMENLSWPTKVEQAGKIALDEARAAGERFSAMKFQLQRDVLSAWAEYVLTSEELRIARRNWTLLKIDRGAAEGRVAAGASQEDMLKAELALARAEDRVRTLESELTARRSQLNAMMAREPGAPLHSPAELPAARKLEAADDVLLAAGAQRNPELAALAHQVQGRADALELARLQWIPDINPFFGFTGTVSQVIGAAVTLPTTIVEIRAGIKEAEAMQRESQAMLRQALSQRGGEFVATLVALRNAERRASLLKHVMLPAAEHLAANAEQCCIAGTTPLSDLIEARQMVFEVRQQIAETWTEREKRLAELEALAGIDVETLAPTDTASDMETSDDNA